jgi:hypothetical protein
MASQGDPTSTRASAAPPPPPPQAEPGIDLTTLVLSAIASAAAAYITSKIWAPGTLFSAAMSPVIVALVKEGLRKPTEVVTSAVPVLARPAAFGRTSNGARVVEPLPDDLGEHLEAGAPPAYPPPEPGAAAGPVRVYSTRGRRLRWRLAVLTGLLGFGVCVVLYTVPEIISGKSISGSGRSTTLFSPKKHHSTSSPAQTQTQPQTTGTTTAPKTTPQQTSTQPTETVTQTVTTPAPPPAGTTTTPPPAQNQAPQTTTPGQAPPPAQTTP